PDRPVLLLASSHGGEEDLLLAAWARVCRELAPLRPALLLAPRHPERAAEVLARVRAQGLSVQRWSRIDPATAGAGPSPDVLVVDVLGLMGTWIAAADLVVMGGSFGPAGRSIGGHNPLEPVRGGRPVVCGPDMANFAELSEQLEVAGWLRRFASLDEALEGVIAWLRHPPQPAALPPLQGPSDQIAATVLERLRALEAG
ncbi:MAG: hypothetical protein WBN89_16125, partial [Prochlorococcaceae cyanobacterium]